MPPRRGRGGAPRQLFRADRTAPGAEKPDIYKPRERYPPASIPKPIPLRQTEVAEIESFRSFRKMVHDGPLYTLLDPHARITKPGDLAGAWSLEYAGAGGTRERNPFEALPTYSQKYKKARRPMPRLTGNGMVYVKQLFPAELQQYIDPSAKGRVEETTKAKTRVATGLEADDDMLEEDEEDFLEEEDDDFEDDEDDDDDYNAENYFEDGRSDAGGDDGAGDDL